MKTASGKPGGRPLATDVPTFTLYARLFTVVALGAASLFLAASQLLPEAEALSFLTQNRRPLTARLASLGVCWGVALLIAASACYWSRLGPTPKQRQRAVLRVSAPFVVAAFLPILFVRQAWEGRDLAYLAYLLCVGLCLERLLHPALVILRRRTRDFDLVRDLKDAFTERSAFRLALFLTASFAIYYVLRIGHLTNVSHFKFQTSSSDLAEYDNLFFNALSGHPFRAPGVATRMEDWSNLANHAEPVMYLLLPFYAIAPGAGALLWIQAGLVGLTAIPIYLLASARLGSWVGFAFSTAFLMMPVTQQPNFYDFHFTSAALFFISWLLYFVYRLKHEPGKKSLRAGVYASLMCSLLCREDIGIGTAVIGVFLVFRGVLVQEGIRITALSGAYFIGVKFLLMPQFGTWWFDDMYGQIKSEGVDGFGSIVVTLLSNQAFVLRAIMNEPKALYLLHMTAPVLALWLRRPLLVLAVIPAMISSLLVTDRPPLFQSSFQYTYLWLGYTIAASILAVDKKRKGATAIALIVLALSLDLQKGVLLGGDRIMGGFSLKDLVVRPQDRQRMKQFQAITKLLPPTATVSVTEREGPHISNRVTWFSLKFALGHDPEYLLVADPGIRGEQAHLKEALEAERYGVIATEGPFTLLKRGASTERNGPLLRRVHGRVKRKSPR
jgi:uncharacterized membrane protein